MTLEQRIAVLEEIFAKLQDYYTSAYSGEEIDARLASAGVPIGITKEYKSVTEMNQDFTGTDVQRGQFVLILPDITSSADYGKVYLKGTANWVPAFTLTTLTSIKGPIGPPGKKGDKGDPGSSFAILGYFDTLNALKAAVPNPKAGGVYGVGTAPPYNIYIWDSVHGKWVPNGNLQGPEGPVGGSRNFVRYDAAQSLTDEQKAQARKNINAVPGGFGIGETPKYIADANDAVKNGRYAIDSSTLNLPEPRVPFWNYSYIDVYTGARPDVYIKQTITSPYQSWHQCEVTRCFYSPRGGWQPWEWINPPMLLGTEYRTTERYLGKPVYAQLIDFGYGPNNANAHVTKTIENIDTIVRWSGTSSDGTAFPFANHMYSPAYVLDGIVYKGSNALHIDLYTNENKSKVHLYVSVFYTKNLDQ